MTGKRIAFAATPAYGHLYPLVPLAIGCQRAGAEVTFLAGSPFVEGMPVTTIDTGFGLMDFETTAEPFLSRMTQAGRAIPEVAIEMFGKAMTQAAREPLRKSLELLEPDLVVCDHMFAAAAATAVALGIPYAWFGTTAPRAIHRAMCALAFEELGASEKDRAVFLDPYPDALATPAVQYPPGLERWRIRPIAWSQSTHIPSWLPVADRTVVYLTLGTVFGNPMKLGDAARALAEDAVEILLATGPGITTDSLGPLPANVHPESFVAQHLILRHVTAVVHHGGSGTVMAALSHGLPQILLPQGADQHRNAEFLVSEGAAMCAEIHDLAPAVRTVMDQNAPQRLAAQELKRQIEALPLPDIVGDQLLRSA